MRLRILVVGLLACWIGSPLPASAATDCSKPKTKIDWLLCSNERVRLEEQRMALAFRGAMGRIDDREVLLKKQSEWTTNVRDLCNDVPCLMQAYRARTEELETY